MQPPIRTYWITTFGCKVNQYESEQLADLLRSRGLAQARAADGADLCVINSCSVTTQAASKSRQAVRRTARDAAPRRILVTGCWATSDKSAAARLQGVDAVLGHHDNLIIEVDRLLAVWQSQPQTPSVKVVGPACCEAQTTATVELPPEGGNDGWMKQVGAPASTLNNDSKSQNGREVKGKMEGRRDDGRAGDVSPLVSLAPEHGRRAGDVSPPVLSGNEGLSSSQQTSGLTPTARLYRQRAFLKIQDGCDAHCTYCIIPKLRPKLWSKPLDNVVEEARRLVDAGHVELVLTGIFLGAYGQPTALRRRQAKVAEASRLCNSGGTPLPPCPPAALASVVEALCARVRGLRRVRLSSLEPGDLTDSLLGVLASHEQVARHLHLPLQSGADDILRRMNRQYRRDDYLRMLDRAEQALDRPALTTDIIVGFPGETDEHYQRTVEVVERARFIQIHAFSFSPRPGTAAARWTRDFVRGPKVNERLMELRRRAREHSMAFRRQFVGERMQVLVERSRPASSDDERIATMSGHQHGRCERYFPIHFASDESPVGRLVNVMLEQVTPDHTLGRLEGEAR